MIFLQLPTEPGASERSRFEEKGVAGFVVSGEIEGKTLSAPLFCLSRFDAALETALTTAGAPQAFLRLRPYSIDQFVDRIVEDHIRSAPTDSIKASYRVLLGRVGISFAKLAFRRLKTALNSSRFSEIKAQGAAAPYMIIDLVEIASLDLEVTRRYAMECAHAEVPLILSPRQLPMLDGWKPPGSGLGDGYAEAKLKVDKLANYQIDLNRIAEDLERIG